MRSEADTTRLPVSLPVGLNRLQTQTIALFVLFTLALALAGREGQAAPKKGKKSAAAHKGAAAKKAAAKVAASLPSSQPVKVKGPGPFAVPGDLPRPARVFAIELHDEVNQGMASFVERVVKELKSGDILLLDIKTFGGRVDAAVTIRDALLHTRDVGARTVAYVNPRAISAGALIAYATDVIAIAPGATMGAATPIQVGGGGEAKPVEEKIVSYMRKEMRSTARARGRRGDVAEAMVDADVEVAGLSKKGKLLTLDGEAALEWGVASFEAPTRPALLEQLGYREPGDHTFELVQRSWAEKIASWLSSTAVSGLLMTIGMLGLMIGLYSGGSPLPLTVGATCLLLFFFGHYVTQLAGIEDMLLFMLGIGLITVEVFVPGTFVPGALGILCVLASLFLGLIDFDKVPLNVQWEAGLVGNALTVVFGSLLATGVLAVVAVRVLPRSPLGRPLILSTVLKGRATDRPGDERVAEIVGQTGTVVSDLRPVGKVLVGGRRYDARAELGYIVADTRIKVVRRRGLELVVSALPSEDAPAADVDGPAEDESQGPSDPAERETR